MGGAVAGVIRISSCQERTSSTGDIDTLRDYTLWRAFVLWKTVSGQCHGLLPNTRYATNPIESVEKCKSDQLC